MFSVFFLTFAFCALRLPKKVFAQKIFGSHLFLQNQKVVFTPQKQWAAIKAARAKVGKVPLSCILECLDSEGRTYFTTNG